MRQLTFLFLLFSFSFVYSQKSNIDPIKIEEDLNVILNSVSHNYAYLQEKDVDLKCIREYYEAQIPKIKSKEEVVLFFEYLLDEFYDSHIHLNTAYNSSFRLYSPIYVTLEENKVIVSNVWQTQINNLKHDIIGAEILMINEIDLEKAIEQFPTYCNDKETINVKEWISNKILSGRYNQPRVLKLKLKDETIIDFDLDKLEIKEEQNLLTVNKIGDIGIIRINNSLGKDEIINEFDNALDSLFNTKGLIIDLRNTVSGGDSYEARGIMSRFINESKPYQRHSFMAKSEGNPDIERSWIEYVSPRKEQYKNPVLILVGRWTGSMGEGLAIGFEGMERGQVVGTEMERLAGETYGFSFKHQSFGFSLSTAKLSHINGTPREKYVPTNYVKQTTIEKDEILENAIELIIKMKK